MPKGPHASTYHTRRLLFDAFIQPSYIPNGTSKRVGGEGIHAVHEKRTRETINKDDRLD
jgi:hypothetical protein